MKSYTCPIHGGVASGRFICSVKGCGLSLMTQEEMKIKALVREGYPLKDAKRYVKTK